MLFRCTAQEQYEQLKRTREFTDRWLLDVHLAARSAGKRDFLLPGVCVPCGEATDFTISFDGAWHGAEALRLPNWRETAVCGRCSMNARQRRIAEEIVDRWLSVASERVCDFYFTEQLTPLFEWTCRRFHWVKCQGSEYLTDPISWRLRDARLHHEDVERLSWPDRAFDLVVSCDVLEHVNDPARGLAELARVLKPGGLVLITVPIDLDRADNERRAVATDAGWEHLLPPAYHLNPLSKDGSLVVTDFGWQILDLLRAAGLVDVALNVYWDYQYGHLGVQHFLSGVAGEPV